MQSNQQECGWQLNRADVTSVTSTFHPSSSSNILRASLIASRPCCTKNSWSFFDGGGCFKSSRLASVKDSSLWSSTAMIFFFLKKSRNLKNMFLFYHHTLIQRVLSCDAGSVPISAGDLSPGLSLPRLCVEGLRDWHGRRKKNLSILTWTEAFAWK